MLATGENFGTVTVWQVATGRPRERITTSEIVWGTAFNPDGRTLYTSGDDGMLRGYDLGGSQRFVRRTQALPPRDYLHVLPSDDGTRTAYLWREGEQSWVTFADTTTGATTRPTRLGVELGQGPSIPAAWHPDGQRLAVNDQRAFTVLDARTGQVLGLREPGGVDIGTIAYVEQGGRIAIGTGERIAFYDAGTLESVGRTMGWPAHCCAATSPDGATAVFFEDSPDAASRHWRAVQPATTSTIAEGDLPMAVVHAAFSPDNRLMAVTGSSGEIFTVDTRSGTARRAPTPGHNTQGRFVRFSPDGSRILSGASDGTVSLWATNDLELLGAVSTGTSVAVSPSWNGDLATISAHDGSTFRWDTNVEQTLAYACSMAGRDLTTEEWTQAFGDRRYERTCP